MGIPQADWGRQPAAPPLGAPEWAPRPELPNWGPEPVRLPEPPTAEGNEAQPRQSPFSGAARKPVSLPYRPWSKPAPEEEPPESPVEERWGGLKSGERKFTAAQPMWKNLPRKPVSLPYSPWGKSGGPELPPDEEGSGSGRPRNPRPLLTDPSRYSWSEPKEGPKPYDATEDETSSDYRASGGRVSGGEDESPWSRLDKFFSRLSGDGSGSPDSHAVRRWARSRSDTVAMEAPPPKPYSVKVDSIQKTVTQMRLGLNTCPKPALCTTMALRNKEHSEPSQQCHRKANLYLGGWTKDVLIFAQIESKT